MLIQGHSIDIVTAVEYQGDKGLTITRSSNAPTAWYLIFVEMATKLPQPTLLSQTGASSFP